MTLQDYGKVEVVCIMPQFNRRRYYCVSVEAGLFGPILVRSWGRIGWRNLRRMEQYFDGESLSDALDTANHLITRKLRKGYEVMDCGNQPSGYGNPPPQSVSRAETGFVCCSIEAPEAL